MRNVFLALVLIGIFIKPVFAIKMSNLYHAEIAIASQTSELKEQAIKDGLLQILIKITGNPNIDKLSIVREALNRADYYVNEYHFLPVSTDSSQYQLQIIYDVNDINQLLKKAKVGYLGEERPLILVWLSFMDDKNDVNIIAEDDNNSLFNKVREESKKYGLPLVFPVMDITDMNKITPADINEMNISIIKEASKRYFPDALLIGEIEKNKEGLESHWQLILKDKKLIFVVDNQSLDDLVASVVKKVYQSLSKNNVLKKNNETLWIN